MKQINWLPILEKSTAIIERRLSTQLTIDKDIVNEVADRIDASLASLSMDTMPNVAKVAGHVVFWIRKLKPTGFSANSKHKLLTVNEVVGILVGLAICREYFDDHSKLTVNIPDRIMINWAASLRLHSHSPHSCAITFEFLASDY